MNRRLSIRLPDGLAWGIEVLARRSGRTKSEIVRDALTRAGVRVPSSAESRGEVLRRAAAFRAQQNERAGTAAPIRESRNDLEHRSQLDAPARRHFACEGARPGPGGRVTPGFQEVQQG